MLVDGTLQITTYYFGWYLYNVMWTTLVVSGLAWLPILGIVVDHVIDVRSNGSVMNTEGDSALARLEVSFLLTVMTLAIAVVPSGLTTVSPASFSYDPADITYGSDTFRNAEGAPSTNQTSGSTGTGLDGVTPLQGTDLASGSVPVPPLLYYTMQVSSGLRNSLMSVLDVTGGSYRALRNAANLSMIRDPGLKLAVNDFYTQCYLPALDRHRNTRSVNRSLDSEIGAATPPPTPAPASARTSEDIEWIGAQLFQLEYYPQIRTRNPVNSFAASELIDTDTPWVDGDGRAGRPLCSAYWVKLRDQIWSMAQADGVVGTVERVSLREGATIGVDDTAAANGTRPFRDSIARTYLNNEEVSVSMDIDRAFATRGMDTGGFRAAIDGVASIVGVAQMAPKAVAAELMVPNIIVFLYYTHSIAMVVTLMSLPLVAMFSRYSLSASFGAAVFLLLLNFLPAVWSVVAWLDNYAGMALFQGKSYFETVLEMSPEKIQMRLAHSLAVAGAYLLVSMLFAGVIAISGLRAAAAFSGATGRMAGAPGAMGVSPTGVRNGIVGAGDRAMRARNHRADRAAAKARG